MLDAEEIAWWKLYDAVEPITGPSDAQLAQIAADLVGIQVPPAYRPRREDYLPIVRQKPITPEDDEAAQWAMLRRFADTPLQG